METCDCCGIKVDERAMELIDDTYYVCKACTGMYTDEEIIDKIQSESD